MGTDETETESSRMSMVHTKYGQYPLISVKLMENIFDQNVNHSRNNKTEI